MNFADGCNNKYRNDIRILNLLMKFKMDQGVSNLIEWFMCLGNNTVIINNITNIYFIEKISNHIIRKKLIERTDYVLTIRESHLFERIKASNLFKR
jgi:hypothetical protein